MDETTAASIVSAHLETDRVLRPRWEDPRFVATTSWREDALNAIADPELGTSGVALVELSLSQPHPHFYGIVRVDDRGIWYSDADGSPSDPAWRLRLIPWHQIEGITLHQSS